jgi:hypothetical protein
MKIVSQSQDELVLQDGSATGIAIGVVFVIAGALVGYKLHASNPAGLWIGLAIAAVGVAIILFSSSITVTARKSTGQLSYQKKRLIGGQDSTYAFADIFRIETRKQWRMENAGSPANREANPPQPMLVAQSVIVFKDGRELPLDHQKTSSTTSVGSVVLMSGQGKETALAARVAEFLGVPFNEIAPPNVGGGIGITFR